MLPQQGMAPASRAAWAKRLERGNFNIVGKALLEREHADPLSNDAWLRGYGATSWGFSMHRSRGMAADVSDRDHSTRALALSIEFAFGHSGAGEAGLA